jgi:hypothetical protein
MKERKEAMAALKAARAERAPGSIDDIKNAEAVWGLLNSVAIVVLQRANERLRRPVTIAGEGPDADLIALCDHLIVVAAKQEALYSVRDTVEDEERTEPALDALIEERRDIFDLIEEEPTAWTDQGRDALVRAALVVAERDAEGNVTHRTKGARLAWMVVESLATRSPS